MLHLGVKENKIDIFRHFYTKQILIEKTRMEPNSPLKLNLKKNLMSMQC